MKLVIARMEDILTVIARPYNVLRLTGINKTGQGAIPAIFASAGQVKGVISDMNSTTKRNG